jgi:hypothetical protein
MPYGRRRQAKSGIANEHSTASPNRWLFSALYTANVILQLPRRSHRRSDLLHHSLNVSLLTLVLALNLNLLQLDARAHNPLSNTRQLRNWPTVCNRYSLWPAMLCYQWRIAAFKE